MALKAKGKQAIQAFIDEGKEFTHETLKGRKYLAGTGKLAEPFKSLIASQAQAGPIRILYSYDTPIAWLPDGFVNWVFPPAKYSVTTTNHQNVAATAIANPGFYKGVKF